MSVKIKNSKGEWIVDQKAIQTSILDVGNNFISNNVEGALRELAEKKSRSDLQLAAKVEANTANINALEKRVTKNEEDIEWLKANGGGDGGTIVPAISSSFVDCSIDKGEDVTIPIFFTSPSGGNGTAYITINDIEVDTCGVRQGNNNVKILSSYLKQTENRIGIYVRDRAGIASNQLSWTVIVGGITLTTSFDYEVDYGVTDKISIPYNIETGMEGEIKLHLTLNGTQYEQVSVNGYNEYILSEHNLGLGTHSVSMYATVGKYKSATISFNVVIVSTTELYLSSSFVNGSKFLFGVPIPVNYRLSKITSQTYTVHLIIDGSISKTLKLPVGSYYWTITDLAVGVHTLTIRAISDDNTEDKKLDLTVEVEKGKYEPVLDYKYGLICDLNAVGKTNQDSSGSVWIDDSGNNHNANLVGFNFSTNGFVDDLLICDNDAYVEIPWSPWANNATNGSTIDIIYTPINSGVEDCRVLDYTFVTDNQSTQEIKPFKGVFADIVQSIGSSSSSGQSAGKIHLDDESGQIHLTWVLDRENKFFKTYINGVLSRIMYLTDSGTGVDKFYEDFSHDNYIYLNSTKGLNCGTYNIKRFRVYGHALTSDQVLQNELANITDLEKQEELFNFNYNNSTLPKMKLFGDTTNMTDKQTVDMRIEYISPNEEKFGQSFNTGIQNNPVRIQGTSSLAYIRKNYTIFLKDEYGREMFYNPYGQGSVEDYVFCLKCDYVESSHANNTGLAKFINDCVYDTKLPPQLENPNCRSTINGFPIEVYMNGEYMGIYNFNHDRYSIMSYGYDYKKYPNMLVYEVNSNSNVSAGAFYKYGENAESSANISEREYYARDFKLIYGNRTESSDSYSEIKQLVEWVSIAQQDLFRETISEHFNTEYLFRYLLTVLMIGGVDSLGKNMKLNTFDGKTWFPTFYDLDTTLGIDNTGYLTVPADAEIEEGMFNTSNSNLWTKVLEFFAKELKEEWSAMRQKNFTLSKLMSYIYGEQISSIPTRHYNLDADVKYLQFGSLYTYCCHGNKEHLVKRWIRERIAYVDSMLEYFTSQEDQIILRMNKTGKVEFNVTSYIPLYFSVKWSNAQGGLQTIKVKRGQSYTFNYNSTTSTDQEVIIYHAQYVKKVDNLTNLRLSSCLIANAYKLTEVEIHSDLLYNINVSENKFLRRLDLSGCKDFGTVVAVGSSINLSACKYLKYVNLYGTSLTDVIFNSKGGSLREIYYPETIQSVQMIKQPLLDVLGLPYGQLGEQIPTALYTVDIRDCPNITKLNTSTNDLKNKTMASMIHCSNLIVRNSLNLSKLTFDGFFKLRNVSIQNMPLLYSVGFDDMLSNSDNATLAYIELENCPKLTSITLNCSSDSFKVAFLDNAILNVGGLTNLTSISSNYLLQGLKTIIVPIQLKTLDFKGVYGQGYCSVKNIWASSQCSVNTDGVTPTATHIINGYEGIDFKGMNLELLDMMGFMMIKNGINFNLSPTLTNPNLNTARDGSELKPWFRPSGTLNLSNYEGEFNSIFKGLDLDIINIILPQGNLDHSNISNIFEGTIFNNSDIVNYIISRFSNATNLDYAFKDSDITDGSKIVFPRSRFTLKGGFMGSKLVSDISLPLNVVNVTDCFRDCLQLKYATSNWNKKYTYTIQTDSCYYNCINIERIDGKPGKIDEIPFEWGGFGFDNDSISVYTFQIPTPDYELNLGYTILDGTVSWGDGSFTHKEVNHIYSQAGTYTVKGKIVINELAQKPHSSVCKSLVSVNNLPSNLTHFQNMFRDCTLLRNVNTSNVDTSKVENYSNTFENCTSLIVSPELDYSSISYMSQMFKGCANITSIKIKNLKRPTVDCTSFVDDCGKLSTLTFNGIVNNLAARTVIQVVNELMIRLSVDTQSLKENIDVIKDKINVIGIEQKIQDNDIVVNLMASTDIFELVLTHIMSTMSNTDKYSQNGKGGESMVEVYVTLILKGLKTINEVPVLIRPQVEQRLKDLGIEYQK